jgi:hypothetical protein
VFVATVTCRFVSKSKKISVVEFGDKGTSVCGKACREPLQYIDPGEMDTRRPGLLTDGANALLLEFNWVHLRSVIGLWKECGPGFVHFPNAP